MMSDGGGKRSQDALARLACKPKPIIINVTIGFVTFCIASCPTSHRELSPHSGGWIARATHKSKPNINAHNQRLRHGNATARPGHENEKDHDSNVQQQNKNTTAKQGSKLNTPTRNTQCNSEAAMRTRMEKPDVRTNAIHNSPKLPFGE